MLWELSQDAICAHAKLRDIRTTQALMVVLERDTIYEDEQSTAAQETQIHVLLVCMVNMWLLGY